MAHCKAGDIYERTFTVTDEYGAIDNYYLYGTVIYADDEVFIIGISGRSFGEFDFFSIPLSRCREYYPGVNYTFEREGNPFADHFIPMAQGTEEFLFKDTQNIKEMQEMMDDMEASDRNWDELERPADEDKNNEPPAAV